jgi:hypothetical protein
MSNFEVYHDYMYDFYIKTKNIEYRLTNVEFRSVSRLHAGLHH